MIDTPISYSHPFCYTLSKQEEADLKRYFEKVSISYICNETLAPYTSLKIGGKARLFVEPKNVEELKKLCAVVLCPYILSGGSNLLISDAGVGGVVLHIDKAFSGLSHEGRTIRALSGTKLMRLISYSCALGLEGLAFASGIPGKVGGAIYMNAGTGSQFIGEYKESVEAIAPDGTLHTFSKKELEWGYRSSSFQKTYASFLVYAATFVLKEGTSSHAKSAVQKHMTYRRRVQPLSQPNVGSVFKNPPFRSSWKLIEETGLKGYRIGNAQISPLHANFIVNLGGATEREVYQLMLYVQKKVLDNTGLLLEPEVCLWGVF